jgi:hypothetical protein
MSDFVATVTLRTRFYLLAGSTMITPLRNQDIGTNETSMFEDDLAGTSNNPDHTVFKLRLIGEPITWS